MRLASKFKACRKCKYLVPKDESTCPVCGFNEFSDKWSGLIIVIDVNSFIAKKLNITKEGYYAVKIL